jgi:hypothetical protein
MHDMSSIMRASQPLATAKEQEEAANPTPKKKKRPVTTWRVSLRGTKLLPRRVDIIEAATLRRNKFGDLILTGKDGVVVASYNRMAIIGAVRIENYKEARSRRESNKPRKAEG